MRHANLKISLTLIALMLATSLAAGGLWSTPVSASDADTVWLNVRSGKYHCEGSRWYERTRRGGYVSEAAALARGFRPAYGQHCFDSSVIRSRAAMTAELSGPDADASINVWANLKSRVYHCPGATWYGKTRRGRYMAQDVAMAQGFRPAYRRRCR